MDRRVKPGYDAEFVEPLLGRLNTHSVSPYALEHLLDVSDWRVRQNAVAEIENKRPAAERCKKRIDAAIERRAAGAQRQRIEIALHRPFALDRIARKIQI